MEEVAEHELVSKEFDAPKEAPKKEKKSIFLQWIILGEKQLCELCRKTKAPLC